MSHEQMPEISEEWLAQQTHQVQAVIRLLLERIEVLEKRNAALEKRCTQLEQRLGMTPQNSSLPPSSQHPHAGKPASPKKPKPKKKRGAQKGHKKHQRTLVPLEEVTEIVPLFPQQCRGCQAKLTGTDPNAYRHQVFELPEIKPIITEYQQHKLTCTCCGLSTTALLPAGVPRGQTGPRLAAFTVLLMAHFRQSKRRTALFLNSLLNILCSVGLTVKLQKMATQSLHDCYEQLLSALPRSDVVAMDETPTKQANSKFWLWTAVTKDFTLFRITDSRKSDVVKELLGEPHKPFSGIVCSDRYGGYEWIERRQLCWSHLLRDFQSLIDAGGKSAPIGVRLKDAGQNLFHHWHRYREGKIARSTMRQNIIKLKWPIYESLEEGTLHLEGKSAGKCQHILDRFDFLWTFCDHADVEPTNNVSERALRHAVIWRKLSFGTQSESGSRFVETLLTVIETCRVQNRNLFDFVTSALESHFHGTPGPKLLTEA